MSNLNNVVLAKPAWQVKFEANPFWSSTLFKTLPAEIFLQLGNKYIEQAQLFGSVFLTLQNLITSGSYRAISDDNSINICTKPWVTKLESAFSS